VRKLKTDDRRSDIDANSNGWGRRASNVATDVIPHNMVISEINW